MKWLLDTNVASESVRARPSPAVIRWIAARPPEELAISIVTLAELRDGALTARDEARRRVLSQWIDTEIANSFHNRTLSLTTEILIDWLQLSRRLTAKGRPQVAADLLIASTARVHDLVVASRNTRHFAGTGVIVYDPWSGKTHKTGPP